MGKPWMEMKIGNLGWIGNSNEFEYDMALKSTNNMKINLFLFVNMKIKSSIYSNS